jgi:hypothetical protein
MGQGHAKIAPRDNGRVRGSISCIRTSSSRIPSCIRRRRYPVGRCRRWFSLKALAGFLAGKVLSANQIEFINLVVDHLSAHGLIEPSRLYESPFTDIAPHGPNGLFKPAEVEALVRTLGAVRESAVAA